MRDQKYKIKYRLDIETGEFTPDDIDDKELEGLSDNLVVVSLLKEELDDGRLGVSIMFSDFSGETEDARISTEDMFLVWLALANGLKQKTDLGMTERNLARMVEDLAEMTKSSKLEIMRALAEKGEAN